MVFIVCEGNEFQGTLDKVWKLNEILMKEPAKVHQNAINYNIETVYKNTTVQSWQTNIDIKEQDAVHNIPSLGSCICLFYSKT